MRSLTIEINKWQTIEGEIRLSKKAARYLSGVKSRSTFVIHCKYLGMSKKQSFSYQEILEIRLLHLWLGSDSGCKHSRSKYLHLKKQSLLLELDFAQRDINPDREMQKIVNLSQKIH
jgi:hypothetical protein